MHERGSSPPMGAANRRTVTVALLGALIASMLLGGAASAEWMTAAELGRAVDARGFYGFKDDPLYVRRLASDTSSRASTEFGFPITAAEARDLSQRAAFVQRLQRSTLSQVRRMPGYAGAWIDQRAGGRLVVGLTSASAKLKNSVRRSMPAVSRGVSFVEVDDSAAALAAGLRRAPAAWDQLASGIEAQAFAIHYRDNRITVKVRQDQLEAARRWGDQLEARLGVDVGFVASARVTDLAPRSACTSRTRCYGPFRLGVRVNFQTSYPSPKIKTYCAMAFHVRDPGGSGKDHSFLTSGHCTYGRAGPWHHHDDYRASYGKIGRRVASKYTSEKRDIALVKIEDWKANNTTRIYGDEGWSNGARLTAEGQVVEGEVLCTSLARSNRIWCGVADATDQWWISTTAKPNIRVRGAAMDFPGVGTRRPIPGDSGSPIYRRWTTDSANPEPRRTPIGVAAAGSIDTPGQQEEHALYFAPVWWALNAPNGWPNLRIHVDAPPPLPQQAFTATWVGAGGNDHRTRFSARELEDATSYRWDLGDGSAARFGRQLTYRYRNAGEYAVKLTVTFRGGYKRSRTIRVAANPVRTYAPLVYLHPAETARPIAVETFLDDAILAFAHDAGCAPSIIESGSVDASRLGSGGYAGRVADDTDCSLSEATYASDLATRPRDAGNQLPADERGEGFYLDLDDDSRAGTALTRDPTYFEFKAGRYVIYWFFYAYNDHGNQHEGDWEHIAVRLSDTGLGEQFAYYRHECKPRIFGRANMRNGFGQGSTGFFARTHPIVYAAKGSHASYWKRRSAWTILSGCGLPLPFQADQTAKGAAWRTWLRLRDARTDWYGYGGAWGPAGAAAAGAPINDGPLGPSSYKLPDAVPAWW